MVSVPCGAHLSSFQLAEVYNRNLHLNLTCSPLRQTNLKEHHIETSPGVEVRSRPYRLPKHKKKVCEELEAMLEMGIIEESHSDWASPIVLVPKANGSTRFCIDYRKVDAVSKFDAYPMPRVDELLDRLGTARFYLTLDLTKGYWQIPLTPMSQEKQPLPLCLGYTNFLHFLSGCLRLQLHFSALWTGSYDPIRHMLPPT